VIWVLAMLIIWLKAKYSIANYPNYLRVPKTWNSTILWTTFEDRVTRRRSSSAISLSWRIQCFKLQPNFMVNYRATVATKSQPKAMRSAASQKQATIPQLLLLISNQQKAATTAIVVRHNLKPEVVNVTNKWHSDLRCFPLRTTTRCMF